MISEASASRIRVTIGRTPFLSHGDVGWADAEGGLGIAHGDSLSLLAAGSKAEAQVASDPVDHPEHFGAVPCDGGSADRLPPRAILDPVPLGDLEHEVAGDGVDLPAPHLEDEEPSFHALEDLAGGSGTRQDDGIAHAGDRLLPVGLATPLPAFREPSRRRRSKQGCLPLPSRAHPCRRTSPGEQGPPPGHARWLRGPSCRPLPPRRRPASSPPPSSRPRAAVPPP